MALERYLEQRDALMAGRDPAEFNGGCRIADAVDAFLSWKQRLVDACDLAHRTWKLYFDACRHVVAHFGKTRSVETLAPLDFAKLRDELAKRYTPTTLNNRITMIRSVFRFCWQTGLIRQPVRYGTQFGKPSQRTLRRHRQARPRKAAQPGGAARDAA